MRSVLVLILALLSGCCTAKAYEDMRERAQSAEKELAEARLWLAGKDDDNASLQTYCLKLEEEIRRWQFGSMVQAKREAELRRSCDI